MAVDSRMRINCRKNEVPELFVYGSAPCRVLKKFLKNYVYFDCNNNFACE